MAPLVSIIIPCYNGEASIAEAVASALTQSYTPREVIVIDDGSTDASARISRSFGSAIKWRVGPHRGGAAVRNEGLFLAQGEFVQFLDADDILLPAKLENDVDRLVLCGADVCLSAFEVVDRPENTVAGPKGAPVGDPFEWILTADVRIVPLYRRTTLAAIGGFDSDLSCCQDYDLNMRLALRSPKYVFSEYVGYRVRRRSGSVSSDEVRLYRVMVDVLSKTSSHLSVSDQRRESRLNAIAGKMAACGRWLIRCGDREGGLKAFAAARRAHESGGLRRAYSSPALALRRLLGPVNAEKVLWRWRQRRSAPGRIDAAVIAGRT